MPSHGCTVNASSSQGGVRAVSFDLDGTLYRARPVHLRFLLRNFLYARTIRVARAVRDELRSVELDDGEAFFGEEAKRIAERLDTDPVIVRARLDMLFGERLCQTLRDVGPRQDAREALGLLVDAGVKIAVISDYRVEDKLAALGLADLPWSALVAGECIGTLKPSARPFVVAAQELGVDPADMVHVGDRADTDGVGATRAGVRSLLVDADHGLVDRVREILTGGPAGL
jgi:FMN phosphatase YigB (HAD superfamily)